MFVISQMCIPPPLICNWVSLVFIDLKISIDAPWISTSVSPESSEGEVWGTPERSGEVWGTLDRSGEVWRAPESSGQVWSGPSSSGQVWRGLGSLQSSGEVQGAPGAGLRTRMHQDSATQKPKNPKNPKFNH